MNSRMMCNQGKGLGKDSERMKSVSVIPSVQELLMLLIVRMNRKSDRDEAVLEAEMLTRYHPILN